MFKRPGSGWGAVAIVLTAWAGGTAPGADDSPEKAPRWADGVQKTAEEAPKSPEAVLSARGLTRSGASYLLEKQEEECFKKFDDIRPLYEQLETSYNQLVAIAMSEAEVAELQAEQVMTQQQLQSLSASGNSMSRYGGRYARYAQNPNTQLQQQLRAQQSTLSQQLAMAKQQAIPAKQKQETLALYEKHRNELLESSTEVRELFEKVQKEYIDVEAEPPVRTALGALRKLARAQLKIAPSAEFNKRLAQLKKLERMMRPESASQASSAKGKSKSKLGEIEALRSCLLPSVDRAVGGCAGTRNQYREARRGRPTHVPSLERSAMSGCHYAARRSPCPGDSPPPPRPLRSSSGPRSATTWSSSGTDPSACGARPPPGPASTSGWPASGRRHRRARRPVGGHPGPPPGWRPACPVGRRRRGTRPRSATCSSGTSGSVPASRTCR